ncbi:MAG TPA: hypothetical protein VGO52_10270 [Hyphomonadaceae bacterium]|jgi:hypothetical protein|nr:hypothetical protein [Hyphomonadaceae bacterium]
MTERLIRPVLSWALAFVVAFVFAGRMEAAAQHCARLALELAAPIAAEVSQAEEMPCHGGHEMGLKAEAPVKAASKAHHHGNTGERCDCVGVLKAFAEVGAAVRSAHIEPYEWARPEAAVFASIEPQPDWRPPRA